MSARRGVGRAVAARTLGPRPVHCPLGARVTILSVHPHSRPMSPWSARTSASVAGAQPLSTPRRVRGPALGVHPHGHPTSRRSCAARADASALDQGSPLSGSSAVLIGITSAVRKRSIERYQPSGPRPLGVRRSERERSPGRSRTPTSAPSALSVPAASTVARAAGATTRWASRQPAVSWPAARRSPLSGVVTVGPAAAAAA